jgi:hypothetical protein
MMPDLLIAVRKNPFRPFFIVQTSSHQYNALQRRGKMEIGFAKARGAP